MSWNYRIILHKAGHVKDNPKIKWDEYLALHEVFYDENENPKGATEKPVEIVGDEGKDSLISIKWTLEKMIEALHKPILEYDNDDNLEEIDKEKQDDFSKSIKEKE